MSLVETVVPGIATVRTRVLQPLALYARSQRLQRLREAGVEEQVSEQVEEQRDTIHPPRDCAKQRKWYDDGTRNKCCV
jgi:hypothetical protein